MFEVVSGTVSNSKIAKLASLELVYSVGFSQLYFWSGSFVKDCPGTGLPLSMLSCIKLIAFSEVAIILSYVR